MDKYLKNCRSGIFRETDKLINHVIWYCRSKIEEDLKNKENRIKDFSEKIKCDDSYHKGYDKASSMTINVLEEVNSSTNDDSLQIKTKLFDMRNITKAAMNLIKEMHLSDKDKSTIESKLVKMDHMIDEASSLINEIYT